MVQASLPSGTSALKSAFTGESRLNVSPGGDKLASGCISNTAIRRVSGSVAFAGSLPSPSTALLVRCFGWLALTTITSLAVGIGFFGVGWNGVQHTLMAELAGTRRAGTAVGLGLALSSAGVTLCPPIFGLVVERREIEAYISLPLEARIVLPDGAPHAGAFELRDGKVELSLTTNERSAIVTVEDTGIGIADTDAERVFEPFVRLAAARARETEGSGLGLAIARAIVVAHGGTISLESTPGAGSRFTVRLSLA